jgi:LacI family transcriptional regulator
MAAAGIKRMADLAALAGVSAMTVHRALHDHPGINAATRRRILELAGKHHYRPNGIARAMRKGQTGTVGLAVGAADIEMAVLVGIHRVLNAAGMSLSFAEIPYPGQVTQPSIPRFFAENLLEGLIYHASVLERDAITAGLTMPGMPTVSIMGAGTSNCVTPGFADGVADACRRITAAGYRRILYLGPVHAPMSHPAGPVYRHFRNWVKANGASHGKIATDIEIPLAQWTTALASRLRRERGRVAVLSAMGQEARTAHAVIRDLGLDCPGRVGLLAFTTRELVTDAGIAIDAVLTSSFALGEATARLLLDRIAQDGADLPSRAIPFADRPGQTLAAMAKGER